VPKANGRARKKYRWIFVNKKANIEVMKVTAEIVKGRCPSCEEDTMLVGLTTQIYRCLSCGSDLEQHVNGKISYLPHISTPSDKNLMPYVKEWKDG
jgi:ribosomal protein S27E